MAIKPLHLAIAACLSGLCTLPFLLSALIVENPQQSQSQTISPFSKQLYQKARAIAVKILAGDSQGSGIIIAKNGQTYTVVTNAHVITRSQSYSLITSDRKIHKAKLISQGDSFAGNDLALLLFQATENYEVATLGNSATSAKNSKVIAAGFPFESEQIVFTTGKISLIMDKPLVGGYQIGFTNETKQGMSGGVLLDERGKVIGVLGQRNTSVIDDVYIYWDGSHPDERTLKKMRRISFAVPIATVIKMQKQAIPYGKASTNSNGKPSDKRAKN
jgi:S1-C subfamily serine protease